jgi:hypothetical protein
VFIHYPKLPMRHTRCGQLKAYSRGFAEPGSPRAQRADPSSSWQGSTSGTSFSKATRERGRKDPACPEAEAYLYLFPHICSVSSPTRGFDSTKWRASVYSDAETGNRPANLRAKSANGWENMSDHAYRSEPRPGRFSWKLPLARCAVALVPEMTLQSHDFRGV